MRGQQSWGPANMSAGTKIHRWNDNKMHLTISPVCPSKRGACSPLVICPRHPRPHHVRQVPASDRLPHAHASNRCDVFQLKYFICSMIDGHQSKSHMHPCLTGHVPTILYEIGYQRHGIEKQGPCFRKATTSG